MLVYKYYTECTTLQINDYKLLLPVQQINFLSQDNRRSFIVGVKLFFTIDQIHKIVTYTEYVSTSAWHTDCSEPNTYLFQKGKIQALHQMGVFHVTPQVLGLLNQLLPPLSIVFSSEWSTNESQIILWAFSHINSLGI